MAATSAATEIWRRIDEGGERIWRFQDFEPLPFPAVTQALSRLARKGLIQRISKGLYYRPRKTAFGSSRPAPDLLRALPIRGKTMFPAGTAAANLLGFTTQMPAKAEYSTTKGSLPQSMIGKGAKLHTRRPEAWKVLSESDAAILEFLRGRGLASELEPVETTKRLLSLLRDEGRYERLAKAAFSEPPRVRAMLGCIGEQLRTGEPYRRKLRETLNPLSRFDFGNLSGLKHASEWQAKESR
jgi:hypothetical protein